MGCAGPMALYTRVRHRGSLNQQEVLGFLGLRVRAILWACEEYVVDTAAVLSPPPEPAAGPSCRPPCALGHPCHSGQGRCPADSGRGLTRTILAPSALRRLAPARSVQLGHREPVAVRSAWCGRPPPGASAWLMAQPLESRAPRESAGTPHEAESGEVVLGAVDGGPTAAWQVVGDQCDCFLDGLRLADGYSVA
jgi:hypothetical protein